MLRLIILLYGYLKMDITKLQVLLLKEAKQLILLLKDSLLVM